jgi:CRP-like cAMP-binding protein
VPDLGATTVERLLALKLVAPFSSLPPDDLALLIDRAKPRFLDEGDVLVHEGVPLDAIHLLLSGSLAEERNGQPWATRTPYELVGGVDALAQTGERLVVRATQPTQTLELDRTTLLEICLDRFGILATVASGVAAMEIAARRRLGASAGYDRAPDAAAAPLAPAGTIDVSTIVEHLHAVAPLGGTPIHTLVYAAGEGTAVTLEPGHLLWRAGDPADHVVLVLSGRVDCVTADEAQRFSFDAGGAVGLLDALALVPRWYGAIAATRVVGLRLPIATLLDILEDDPETAVAALVRLAEATARLVDAVARSAPDRV